jgi:hypothetical protein
LDDTIKLRCKCGQHIEVNRNAAGQRFRCPSCDILLAVPKVPVKAKAIEEADPATSIQSTKKEYKQAIILSVLIFIGGIILGVTGVGINRKPVWISGIIVSVIGFGGLLQVKSQIRRNQIQDKERIEFYRKYSKRS